MNADYLPKTLTSLEPKRCFASLTGDCDQMPVKAHFIQRARLKRIADGKGRVRVLYNDSPETWIHSGFARVPENLFGGLLHYRSAATQRCICSRHESMFDAIENSKPDWEIPENPALLAFRTTIVNRYVKEWFGRACSEMGREPYESVAAVTWDQKNRAAPLLEDIRASLREKDFGNLRSKTIHIDRPAAIAATGVVIFPPVGTYVYVRPNNSVVPSTSSPIVVTVLPEERGHVLLLTFQRDNSLDAQFFLDGILNSDGSVITAFLSKLLLDTIEHIHISPIVWESFGRTKQERIAQHVARSTALGQSTIETPAHLLDLFPSN